MSTISSIPLVYMYVWRYFVGCLPCLRSCLTSFYVCPRLLRVSFQFQFMSIWFFLIYHSFIYIQFYHPYYLRKNNHFFPFCLFDMHIQNTHIPFPSLISFCYLVSGWSIIQGCHKPILNSYFFCS